jgi:hypothetical protein
MSDQMQFYLLLFAIAVVFVVFWTVLPRLIAALTGWKKLAERYRAAARPEGKTFNWQSAGIRGPGGYNNALTIIIAPDGLYISLMGIFAPFFGPGHPPLLIPWADLDYKGEKKIFLCPPFAVLSIVPIHGMEIRLPMKIYDAARRHIDAARRAS